MKEDELHSVNSKIKWINFEQTKDLKDDLYEKINNIYNKYKQEYDQINSPDKFEIFKLYDQTYIENLIMNYDDNKFYEDLKSLKSLFLTYLSDNKFSDEFLK